MYFSRKSFTHKFHKNSLLKIITNMDVKLNNKLNNMSEAFYIILFQLYEIKYLYSMFPCSLPWSLRRRTSLYISIYFMVIFFFNDNTMHYKCLPPRHTVNKDYYLGKCYEEDPINLKEWLNIFNFMNKSIS